MNLSKFAVERPVTITMFILIVLLFGFISLSGLPIDLYPEIEIPVVIVSTSYQGAGPQEIESLITERIESVVATVSNIDEVSSISSEGSSVVVAQFNFGTDMDFASLEMREKVDLIKGLLPSDASDPMVIRIDPNATAIVQIALSSKGGDLVGLQNLAENEIKQNFERIDGVAQVDIGGGEEEEVSVVVDPYKLSSYGLNMDQIKGLISGSNMNLPGGEVKNGKEELSVRLVGEFDSLDDIKNLPIILKTGSTITLEDVANIDYKNKDRSIISRVNGRNSISMGIQKQSGKNTVEVANQVKKEMERLEKEYKEIEFDIVLDNSEFISTSINNVKSNVLTGSLFAVLVLYIFLKSIRTTFIVGVSIPISLIASFILLYMNKITLNMMTLGGLALAVGMLVDSAIVVLENIYRLKSQGLDSKQAAIKGAKEVGMSITASTLTTIAVFLPIVFVEGVIGIMFKDFALTVTLSLIASLVVALTMIPMLSSKLLTNTYSTRRKFLQPVYDAFDRVIFKLENLYKKVLNKGLKYRKTTVAIGIIFFVVTMASLIFVGIEFFPTTDEGALNINIKLPIGSTLEMVDEISLAIEEKISNIEEIETIFTNIGSGDFTSGSTSNTGSIFVKLKDLKDRTKSADEVSEIVRKEVKDIAGAEITVSSMNMTAMAGTTPISIKLKGNDLDILEEISNDFVDLVKSVSGTREVKGSISEAVPELEIKINKDMAAVYGLTTPQIAGNVRTATMGSTVTKYRIDGDEIDVILKAEDEYTNDIGNLENLEIDSPLGLTVPLVQVADFNIVDGPIRINRESQERVVTVSSDISGRDLGSIVRDIENELKEYNMPDGYRYEISGENEDMIEAFTNLLKALGVAVILIYMIMAAQFESLLHPFLIMFTMPLAFGGGIFGLFIANTPFGVTAFIGIIMLAGIVVNNGIVLVDYINQLRKDGMEITEAIKEAGPIRLRPILMTTLTTVLGLVPLALGIGEGAEIQAPMAIVVISGLTFATILTLVFVPVLYYIFENVSSKVKTKFSNLIYKEV